MTLDAFTGMLCIWMALCFAAAFTFLSRKATKWITAPEYVRIGLVVVSLMFLWRGANLLSLSGSSLPVAGHANAEAAMATISMAYLVTSVSVWIAASVMPNHAWERLAWVKKMLRKTPDRAPILVDPVEAAHAAGFQATGPREGAHAVVRESRRVRSHVA